MADRNHGPCSATGGDMQMVIHGLKGIFWALNVLVVQQAANDIAHKEDLSDGIANLIVAGDCLAGEIRKRF